MWELIKIFIANLFVEKKYRYIFIFITISLAYRTFKWAYVFSKYTQYPVKFVRVNNNGTLQLKFVGYEQNIYPTDYQLPSFYSIDHCERDYFQHVYVEALKPFIDDKHGQRFAIEFTSKFIRKKGEVYLETQSKRVKPIYQSLFAQEIIFPKNEEVDYCQQMRKRHLYDEHGNIARP